MGVRGDVERKKKISCRDRPERGENGGRGSSREAVGRAVSFKIASYRHRVRRNSGRENEKNLIMGRIAVACLVGIVLAMAMMMANTKAEHYEWNGYEYEVRKEVEWLGQPDYEWRPGDDDQICDAFANATFPASSYVFLEKERNVTLDGEPLTPLNVSHYDWTFRHLHVFPCTVNDTRIGGNKSLLGFAVSATGSLALGDSSGDGAQEEDSQTNVTTLALSAAYLRPSNVTERPLPLCAISYFVNASSTQCFYVPERPIDNWNTLFARNTIGSFALSVHELDEYGDEVNHFFLGNATWQRTGLAPIEEQAKQLVAVEWRANLTLSGNATTSSSDGESLTMGTVYVAFVQTAQVGNLNVFEAPMVPKAWKTIVRVQDYLFASEFNTLVLTVAALTGPGANTSLTGVLSLESVAEPTLNTTIPIDTALCILSEVAWLDNNTWPAGETLNLTEGDLSLYSSSPVNVSSWIEFSPNVYAEDDASIASDPEFVRILYEQVQTQYGSVGFYLANITFPAATSNFTYMFDTEIGPLLLKEDGTLDQLGAGPSQDGSSLTPFATNSPANAATFADLASSLSLGLFILFVFSSLFAL